MSRQPFELDCRYRAEIDGLRALAVLGVVFFHGGFGVPGGYVGVDVFFVISGYLITSLIISEVQRGVFSLVGFWERRVRRIIPALAIMILATLVAGWFFMLPADYVALFKSASWQAAFAANLYFWRINISGYFEGDTDEMPLLHTWSLAVEEQFYLAFPVLLIAFFRLRTFRTQPILLIAVGLGIVTSFAISQYLLLKHPVAAFYLLPSRAWELLLGSVLAILPDGGTFKQVAFREMFALLGIGLIITSFFLYSADTLFPGVSALVPCLGAALFIWANRRGHETPLIQPPTVFGRLLATRPMVFIGLISYSFYLWHWPLLAFGRYYQGGELEVINRLALIALGFFVALISYYQVELPFRRRICYSSNGDSIFKLAIFLLGLTLAFSFTGYAFNGFPNRFPEAWQSALAENVKEDFKFVKNVTTEELAVGDLPIVGVNDVSLPISILVWGDSHAMAALPAFDLMLHQQGLSGRYATHASTAPLLDFYKVTKYGLNKNAPFFNEEVFRYIVNNHVAHVFLVAAWGSYKDGGLTTLDRLASDSEEPLWIDASFSPYELAFLATISKLMASGVQPWVITQIPQQPHDVGKILRSNKNSTPELNQTKFCNKPDGWDGVTGNNPEFLSIIKRAGATIIDPRPAFLNPSGDLYQIEKDGTILYRDDNHLTRKGAENLITPLLHTYFLPCLFTTPR